MPQISGTAIGCWHRQPVFDKPIQRFSFFKPSGALLDDAATRQDLAAGYKLRLQLPRKGQPDGPATHKGKPDVRTPSPLLRRTELIGLRSSGFFRPSRRAEGLAAGLQLFRNGGPNGPAKHKCYPICEPHSHRCGSERDRAAACRFFPGFLGKRTTSSLTVLSSTTQPRASASLLSIDLSFSFPLRAALSASGSAGISSFPASRRLPMIVLTKPSGPLLDDAAARQRLAAGYKLQLQLSRNSQPDGPATHKGEPDFANRTLTLAGRTFSRWIRRNFRFSRRADGFQ